MYYVGLSCVICLENLYILYLNEKKIVVLIVVINEMRRFREECKFQFCVENLFNDYLIVLIVFFFNIWFFYCYIYDLRKDFLVFVFDIIFVLEFCLMVSDDYEFVFL